MDLLAQFIDHDCADRIHTGHSENFSCALRSFCSSLSRQLPTFSSLRKLFESLPKFRSVDRQPFSLRTDDNRKLESLSPNSSLFRPVPFAGPLRFTRTIGHFKRQRDNTVVWMIRDTTFNTPPLRLIYLSHRFSFRYRLFKSQLTFFCVCVSKGA